MRCHEVDRFDSAQRNHRIVSSTITGHTDALDWQKHGESLTRLVVPTGFTQLFDEDVISKLQSVSRFTRHFTQNAYTESGTREWMSVDHLSRQTEFDADTTHFILEQLA